MFNSLNRIIQSTVNNLSKNNSSTRRGTIISVGTDGCQVRFQGKSETVLIPVLTSYMSFTEGDNIIVMIPDGDIHKAQIIAYGFDGSFTG